MEVKTKKNFNEIIKSLTEEIVEEEELEEVNTTASVGGEYMTPFAFKKKKKKKKMTEALDEKDIKLVKRMMRDVIANTLRDIWLKRGSWK